MTNRTGTRERWEQKMKVAIVVTIASSLVQLFGLQFVGYGGELPLRDSFAGIGVIASLAVCYYWYRLRRG